MYVLYLSLKGYMSSLPGISLPWEERMKACSLYMELGNMRLVSEKTDISYDVLSSWRKQEWWTSLSDEIRQAKKAKRGAKLSVLIDQSLEVIQDRLQNGDFILNNKTGVIERKPVTLRDAAQLSNNLLGRQLQIEELTDKLDQQKETVHETLSMLANEFKKFNRMRKADATTVEFVEYKETSDALHEKWETGLQEGSGSLHEQTGSEEEEGSSERS